MNSTVVFQSDQRPALLHLLLQYTLIVHTNSIVIFQSEQRPALLLLLLEYTLIVHTNSIVHETVAVIAGEVSEG